MGLATFTSSGREAVLAYLVVYLFMNLGAFFIVIALEDAGAGDQISSFKGLGYREPLLGVLMVAFLLSLTGLPPMAGFPAKFLLFSAVMERGGPFFVSLAVLGVLNSALSLYYYWRIVKTMYLEQPESNAAVLNVSSLHSAAVVAMGIPTVVLGIYWAPVVYLVSLSLRSFGG